jgi:hypothetical protein
MRLSIKAMAASAALLWGGCMLTIGIVNLIWPTYGGDFLRMISSVYPGFHASHSTGNVVVGSAEGLIDGALAGGLLAWLYNMVSLR